MLQQKQYWKQQLYRDRISDTITIPYHVQTPLYDRSYTVRAEITTISSDIPEQEIFDEFKG
jgi:hypothetical protein